ncbi:MAG TPA: DUF4252 domain-containing protein [Thermoanaerobaculia bacterium]|nr:DUF4252 domain-containing protein [Thermoanaerobaculia bacterium]
MSGCRSAARRAWNLVLPALLGVWLAAPALAQRDLSADPGYVDLGGLGLLREEASLEIALEGPLIRMVAEAVRGEDAGFAELLDNLRAIRVQTFDLAGRDADAILRRGEETVRQLERIGWSPVVRIREEGERIYLYLREQGGAIAGVWVMAADLSDSVTLVNIVGDFDPVELGRLGASLHIDPLEMLGEAARRGGRPDPGGDDR